MTLLAGMDFIHTLRVRLVTESRITLGWSGTRYPALRSKPGELVKFSGSLGPPGPTERSRHSQFTSIQLNPDHNGALHQGLLYARIRYAGHVARNPSQAVGTRVRPSCAS